MIKLMTQITTIKDPDKSPGLAMLRKLKVGDKVKYAALLPALPRHTALECLVSGESEWVFSAHFAGIHCGTFTMTYSMMKDQHTIKAVFKEL